MARNLKISSQAFIYFLVFFRCDFEYMSRIRNTKQLELSVNPIYFDYEEAINSNNWKLLNTSESVGERAYMFDGYNDTYPFVLLSFTIKRQSEAYVHQVMIAAVILAVINLVLLLLNPESMERFVLYVINLFSHGIYIEQLRWM